MTDTTEPTIDRNMERLRRYYRVEWSDGKIDEL